MKKRWIIVLSVVGFLAVAGVVGAYFAMDYGVKRALDLIADDSVVPTETSLPEDTAHSAEPTEPTEPTEPADITLPAEHEDEPQPQTIPETSSEPVTDTEVTEPEVTEPEVVEAEAGKEDNDSSSSTNYTANISSDRAKEVENEITFSEKRKVTTVLLKSFDASDIRLLTELAGGGLTLEEKREAKKLFLERLSPEEYDELIQIAANYGLSQGKSHAESTKNLEK